MVLYWVEKIIEWEEYDDCVVDQVIVHERGEKWVVWFKKCWNMGMDILGDEGVGRGICWKMRR